jgi:hypothetical protein
MVSSIEENLKRVKEALAAAAERSGRDAGEIRLIAVSKTHPVESIMEAVRCGIEAVGENRIQELEEKRRSWEGPPVDWRFIGHLQTNKVRKAVEFSSAVDSVDSPRLALALARAAEERRTTLPVLVEVNSSGEASKHGVHPSQAARLVEVVLEECPALRLDGLMTIGPLSDDISEVRRAFALLRTLRDGLARDFGRPLRELSMGMSGDYEQAVAEGSTMVRIGSAIFGSRSRP